MKQIIFPVSFLLLIYSMSAQNITGYDYWFDGNDTKITQTITGEAPTIDEILSGMGLSSLSPGLHFLYVQFDYDDGSVSDVQSKYFIKPWVDPFSKDDNIITGYEYWIDDHWEQRTQGTNAEDGEYILDKNINFSGLNRGLHFFHIRFKDSENKWSAVQSNYFVISDKPQWENDNNILREYEYWLDDHWDNKVSGTYLNQSTFTLNQKVNYSTLGRGLHFFHIRFKDSEGRWGCVQSNNFVIPDVPPWQNLNNKIASYRYWFNDNDNTIYNMTTVQLDPNVTSYTFSKGIKVPNLTIGTEYQLNIQFQDDHGLKSCVMSSNKFIYQNASPIAFCKDVTVSANLSGCKANASIDNASYDPDGDAITLAYNPPGPFSAGLTPVTLTVTDEHGASSSCTATVTVKVDASITVNPSFPVPGENENTIYLGYGTQSVTLTASTGSSYLWSSSPAGLTSANSSVMVSPSVKTIYTVTVSNQYGCSITRSVTIDVVDWRCGNAKKEHKIKICHKGEVICVDTNAVQAHLVEHGDYIGECWQSRQNELSVTSTEDYLLEQNYPNPFSSGTIIGYYLPQSGHVLLKIFDIFSNRISTLADEVQDEGYHSVNFETENLTSGTYIYVLEVNGNSLSRQMVIIK
jgi:hypothetical protein